MFCRNCGKEVSNEAVVCPYCGVQVNLFNDNPQNNGNEQSNCQVGGNQQPVAVQGSGSKGNVVAVIGLVLSFFIPVVGLPIAGLICSIIGFSKAKHEGAPRKGLALAGIIIGAICSFLQVVIGIVEYSTIMEYLYEFYYYGYVYSSTFSLPLI